MTVALDVGVTVSVVTVADGLCLVLRVDDMRVGCEAMSYVCCAVTRLVKADACAMLADVTVAVADACFLP